MHARPRRGFPIKPEMSRVAKMLRMDARSMEQIDDGDLERLGRAADADMDLFFRRNPHLEEWRDRVLAVALAQGGAEHRLPGEAWHLGSGRDRLLRQSAPEAPPPAGRALGLGAVHVWPLPLRPVRIHRPCG